MKETDRKGYTPHDSNYVTFCSLIAQLVKNPAMQETQVRSLGQEDPWRREWLTHSGILAWGISQTEEPCRSQRVGHN